MNQIILFLTITILVASYAAAQSAPDGASEEISVSFRPSVAIVIGIFSIMFTLTFVLLMYAKFCSSASGSRLYAREPDNHYPNTILSGGRFSGVDKSTIESLPFFRFSTLKGSREGLECAVCLSKFEDNEILRLLPKCKHAFHIGCVDQWLESHSSCPLCRCRVEAQDLTVFNCSNSSRFLFRDPSVRDDPELELFVEREVENDGDRNHGSTRFSIGGSFRKVADWGRSVVAPKEESLLLEIAGETGYSKLKHKIVVSDVVFKNRWSDLNASDLTWLHSDMLSDLSSRRFSTVSDPTVEKVPSKPSDGIKRIREEMERKRALESKFGGGILPCKESSSVDPVGPTASITVGRRSVSEIANVPRFVHRPRDGGVGEGGGDRGKEEKVRRVWLPIARRTVQWLAGRERRPTSRRNIATEV